MGEQITAHLVDTLGSALPYFVWALILSAGLGVIFLCVWLFMPWELQRLFKGVAEEIAFSRRRTVPLDQAILAELRALRMELQERAIHPAPAPASPNAPAPRQVAHPAPTPPASGSALRVLILEDDPSIGDILSQMLTIIGYAPTLTKEGEEAIAAFYAAQQEGKPFAIALFDLRIQGGMGGREAMGVLRNINAQLRVIACSGYFDDDLYRDIINEGFCDILSKPFRIQELSEVLHKNLTS